MVRFLNIAQRNLCAEADILLSKWTSSTVASQEDYSVPSDFLHVSGVYIYNTTTGSKTKLKPMALTSRDPVQNTGNPQFYTVWGGNVSGVNSYSILLNPIPSTSGTNDLIMYGRQQPQTMVTGGTAPEIMTPWQDYLVAYAAWATYIRRGPQWAPMADRMWQTWERGLAKAKEWKNPLMDDWPTTIEDAMGYGTVYYS